MRFITAMRVFGEVARLGSFTAAGRELRLSTASVSRIVAELEADLGARLFNRTTRKIGLTDAGGEFLQRSTGILEEIEILRGQTRERHDVPRGTLRVSSLTAFGNESLAPAIPEFLERYPGLRISVDISNRFVDLVEEHYDVAIRVGAPQDSSLIAQRITTQRIIFVATPDYCRRHGMPRSIDDIRHHRSIIQISGEWGRVHRFKHGGRTIEFETPRDFVVSSPVAVRNAVLTGYGYTLAVDFAVANDIAEGRLVRLLPDYVPIEQPVNAIIPHRRYIPAKTRVFVDYLLETFGERN